MKFEEEAISASGYLVYRELKFALVSTRPEFRSKLQQLVTASPVANPQLPTLLPIDSVILLQT